MKVFKCRCLVFLQPVIQDEQTPQLDRDPPPAQRIAKRRFERAPAYPSVPLQRRTLPQAVQHAAPALCQPTFDGDCKSLLFTERYVGPHAPPHNFPQHGF